MRDNGATVCRHCPCERSGAQGVLAFEFLDRLSCRRQLATRDSEGVVAFSYPLLGQYPFFLETHSFLPFQVTHAGVALVLNEVVVFIALVLN